MKVALIFGIMGQDGSYLADFLLKKNYAVHGVKRKSSSLNTDRVDTLLGDSRKARKQLKWRPKISIKKLVNEMVENDLRILTNNDQQKR